MSIQIDNFPNEEGYFMLWELSISEKESGKRILPIFVNSAMLLRPMAGKRIMDVFLDGNSKLRVSSAPNVDAEIYSKLEKSCMDFAYDLSLIHILFRIEFYLGCVVENRHKQ